MPADCLADISVNEYTGAYCTGQLSDKLMFNLAKGKVYMETQ